MPSDKLTPDDPRMEHRTFTTTSNHTYHYLLANPTKSSSEPAGTVLLIHGFPDLSFGWRAQVPYLLSLNLRVVVPDQLGYGRTDAPQDAVEPYSMKRVSDDMAELMVQGVLRDSPGPKRFVIGGHDWGGFVVWRFVLFYPYLVQGVFSVCTPYSPPREQYMDLETVTDHLPNFKYQLQFAGPEVEAEIRGEDRLRKFFNGMFGGRTVPDGRVVFSTARGVDFEALDSIGPSPLVSPGEIEHYVKEYARRDPPLRGPLNWYRTTRIRWEEELPLAQARVGSAANKIATPSLLVLASRDMALPPAMAGGMGRNFEDLTVKEVAASHWAPVENPEAVNGHIGEFVTRVLKAEEGRRVKASI